MRSVITMLCACAILLGCSPLDEFKKEYRDSRAAQAREQYYKSHPEERSDSPDKQARSVSTNSSTSAEDDVARDFIQKANEKAKKQAIDSVLGKPIFVVYGAMMCGSPSDSQLMRLLESHGGDRLPDSCHAIHGGWGTAMALSPGTGTLFISLHSGESGWFGGLNDTLTCPEHAFARRFAPDAASPPAECAAAFPSSRPANVEDGNRAKVMRLAMCIRFFTIMSNDPQAIDERDSLNDALSDAISMLSDLGVRQDDPFVINVFRWADGRFPNDAWADKVAAVRGCTHLVGWKDAAPESGGQQ